jgi:hypothetical protein
MSLPTRIVAKASLLCLEVVMAELCHGGDGRVVYARECMR